MTLLPRVLLVSLLGVASAVAQSGAENEVDSNRDSDATVAFPAGVDDAYAALSRVIRGADMPSFMKLFHRDYLFAARDGSGLDRGPWRRRWLDKFDLERFPRVTFECESVEESTDTKARVKVRRIVVSQPVGGGTSRLRVETLEDTWEKSEAGWQLMARAERDLHVDGELDDEEAPTSPRMGALAASVGSGDTGSVDAFWRSVAQSGAPLVETVEGDDESVLVTFVLRGDAGVRAVRLVGGQPSVRGRKFLERLEGTDVWFRTERLPRDARFTYSFALERQVRSPQFAGQAASRITVATKTNDPLNPYTLDGRSIVNLPGAVEPAWLAATANSPPEGEIERRTVRSRGLRERRFVSVYSPPGLGDDTEDTKVPAAFLIDDGNYESRRAFRVAMDRWIASDVLPPMMVFLVHSEGSKRSELEVSDELVKFLSEELVEWARDTYPISGRREDTIVGGSGLGGALAALCVASKPKVFGGLVVENARFVEACEGGDVGCLVERLSAIEGPKPGVYLSVGRLEGGAVVAANRHLRDALSARGFSVDYAASESNHHSVAWLDAVAAGLPSLFVR